MMIGGFAAFSSFLCFFFFSRDTISLNYFYFFFFRFALHKIEQELGTEIKPIPKVIDPHLYVAEYQQEDNYDAYDLKSMDHQREREHQQKDLPQQQPAQLVQPTMQQQLVQAQP